MKRDFNELMLSLKKSITPADFFVDFPKVYVNIKEYELHLNILNTLIGKENIEEEFAELIKQYPEVMRSIPILLATHEHKFNIINAPTMDMLKSIKDKNFKFLEEKFICYDFEAIDHPIEDYAEFLKSSGLFDLISNRKIKNLVDYAIGIEVGLDSNSRKNRSGKIMEDVVEEFFKLAGIHYQTQMKYKDIDEQYGTNLCSIGKSTKKFDFVFKSPNNNELIVMEVNCYGTQGSKPNETAKSYIELNDKIKAMNNVKFVWITDGNGWNSSRLNLEDAYDNIEHLYTIKDLEDGILNKL
jgi:type II restriction enzyme